MNMKKLFLATALLLAAAGLAQAQAPATTGPTPTSPLADPTQVPIDGGASLLLASGVAYGLRQRRRA